MAATFRTPGRRPGGAADSLNINSSPSMIPRAQGGPGTPTGISASSDIGSSVSGTTDSRKRQSKKDEVSDLLLTFVDYPGNSSEIRIRVGKERICSSSIV